MPKIHHVKKARKAIPSIGVKVGDEYFWWKTRMKGCKSGIMRRSKTRPKPSQLTHSEYLGAIYSLQEEQFVSRDFDGIQDRIDDVRDRIQEILDREQEKLDNMPEGLQQGDTGQLIQERIDCCESAISDLDNTDVPNEEDYNDDECLKEEYGDIESWKDEEANRIYEEVDEIIGRLE